MEALLAYIYILEAWLQGHCSGIVGFVFSGMVDKGYSGHSYWIGAATYVSGNVRNFLKQHQAMGSLKNFSVSSL